MADESENPFQSPASQTGAIGVKSGEREDVRSVALYQKGIIVCILIYVVALFGQFALPQELRVILGLGVLLLSLTGTVFVFLLSIKLYSTGRGIILGILTLVPCIGLFVLLFVNATATSVLRQNGIKVGLMGARLSDI